MLMAGCGTLKNIEIIILRPLTLLFTISPHSSEKDFIFCIIK